MPTERRFFLHFVPQNNSNKKIRKIDNIVTSPNIIDIYLNDTKLALASLDQFFEKESSPNNDSDYEVIYSIFSDKYSDFWTDINKMKIQNIGSKSRQISIFDICQIQNDENRFSFALKYFMEKYPDLWRNFFMQRYQIQLNNKFKVEREVSALIENKKHSSHKKSGGRIDLTLSDDNTLIIIENKIKSDVNFKPSDLQNSAEINQLNRYSNYANWLKETKQKNKIFLFILAPNYNMLEIDGILNYEKITYKDIYDYLEENISVFQDDANFMAFFDAMHRHTHDNVNDYLYYEMQEKLNRRIKEYHNLN